jgi:phytoene/squalene synthetase
MKKHSIGIDSFEEKYVFDNKSFHDFDNFLKEMVLYNRTLYDDGEKLVHNLKKRQAILIQVFVDSGRNILDKIERNKHKILVDKPKTNKLEKIFIIAKAIVKISILK